MLKEIRVRSVAAMAVGIVCLAILVVGARPRNYQDPLDRTTAKKPLLMLKRDQPESALTITSVTVDDFQDPLMPTIHCNLINNSGKAIAAYSVKHEAVFSQRTGTVSGSVTFSCADAESAMRPGDTRGVEIYGVKYGEMPQNVTLSVDFVEFIDGSRWGPDTLKNSERIDGARAGARAERDALMKVLITGGMEGTISSLDSIQPEPDQTLPRSSEWLDGFRSGVGWIRERIRSKGQNSTEIEKELRRPD